jgi:putative membrane protein
VLAVLAILGVSASGGFTRSGGARFYDLAVPAAAAAAALVSWLVTRWKVDGATLCIETGLLRRDSRQLPVARIQAVDVVRPFLARALGLAELRVRLAGSSHADGRLAYLPEQAAVELRARLLASHYGLDPATPAPAERVMATVPTGRLLGSVVLSSASLLVIVLIGEAVLAVAAPAGFAVVGGTLLWWLITTVPLVWRRVSAEYAFTVAESPDGIRIRRGLLGTVAETIPVRRVQAVRLIEPLLWRPLGWCRLEVDIAGSPGRDRADGSGRLRKTLLPVGPADTAAALLRAIIGAVVPELTQPPARARWKAPLSYHFLAAGHDRTLAVGRTGRLRRATTWVPLEKVQSVRLVQGPLQRRLALATVHADAAGRRVRAEFRDRPADQARQLVNDLAGLSRSARQRATYAAGPQQPPAGPATPAVPSPSAPPRAGQATPAVPSPAVPSPAVPSPSAPPQPMAPQPMAPPAVGAPE